MVLTYRFIYFWPAAGFLFEQGRPPWGHSSTKSAVGYVARLDSEMCNHIHCNPSKPMYLHNESKSSRWGDARKSRFANLDDAEVDGAPPSNKRKSRYVPHEDVVYSSIVPTCVGVQPIEAVCRASKEGTTTRKSRSVCLHGDVQKPSIEPVYQFGLHTWLFFIV